MGKYVCGYNISDFDSKTQKIIKDNNIDKNKSRYIEEGNELSQLLSCTGKSSIYAFETEEVKMSSEWLRGAGAAAAFAFGGFGIGALGESIIPKANAAKTVGNFIRNLTGRIMASPAFFAIGAFGTLALPACLGLAVITPEIERKDIGWKLFEVDDKEKTKTNDNNYQDIKTQFKKGFEELGISKDTELKEYTPQKGEYWTSILKAKYGVDENTAQRMAHRIKDVIYEDSLASKQTPIMYLPDTWTFEGKTYTYNDSNKAERTDNYSDNVKTEMGKMSKDIKY